MLFFARRIRSFFLTPVSRLPKIHLLGGPGNGQTLPMTGSWEQCECLAFVTSHLLAAHNVPYTLAPEHSWSLYRRQPGTKTLYVFYACSRYRPAHVEASYPIPVL